MALPGLVAGLAGVLAFSRAMRSLLFGSKGSTSIVTAISKVWASKPASACSRTGSWQLPTRTPT
jgi:hypothetical protein